VYPVRDAKGNARRGPQGFVNAAKIIMRHVQANRSGAMGPRLKLGQAIGFSRRGSRLAVFVNSKTMEEYIGRDLREKIDNPLIFQPPGAAAASPVTARANGYDAAILIDICNAILAAKAGGKLSGSRYEKMTEQAQIIVSASAKNGIRQLVYAPAGYNPTAEEVITAFKLYVQDEAKKYEPEFPNELYMQWHRLYDIPVPARGNRPPTEAALLAGAFFFFC
jgi:hypothetical protein